MQQIGYLATHGVRKEEIELGLPMARMENEYSQLLGAGHVLFILDACFSGLANTRAGTPSEDDLKTFQTYQQIKILTDHSMRAIFAAGRPQDSALDINGGIFTSAFLDGISGAADYDHNGVVTLLELYLYVQTRVQGQAATKDLASCPNCFNCRRLETGSSYFFTPRVGARHERLGSVAIQAESL